MTWWRGAPFLAPLCHQPARAVARLEPYCEICHESDFAGTPTCPVALARLLAAGSPMPLVLTQPDRPAGRGMKLQASPSSNTRWTMASCRGAAAAACGWTANTLNDCRRPRCLLAAQADASMVVAPPAVSVCPSWCWYARQRLPQYPRQPVAPLAVRAAIHRAIEAGDARKPASPTLQMDAGLDTGDMSAGRKRHAPALSATAACCDRLADAGCANAIVEALSWRPGGSQPVPQLAEGVTWPRTRSSTPRARSTGLASPCHWPAHSRLHPSRRQHRVAGRGDQGVGLRNWIAARAYPIDGAAGQIWHQAQRALTVVTAARARLLCPTTLQRAGGKRLPVADFLRGCRQGQVLLPGTVAALSVTFLGPCAPCQPPVVLGWRAKTWRRPSLGIGAWGYGHGRVMIKSGMSLPMAVFVVAGGVRGSAQLAVLPLLMVGAPAVGVWLHRRVRQPRLSSQQRMAKLLCAPDCCAGGQPLATSSGRRDLVRLYEALS